MAEEKETPLNNIRFGPLAEHNLEQFKQLNLAIFPVHYRDKFYRDCLNPQNKDITKMNILVGAISCRLEPDPNNKGKLQAYIMTIGVLAAYRDRGIGGIFFFDINFLGSKAINHIIQQLEHLPDVTKLTLNVQTSNELAIRFYTEKHGFVKNGIVKDFYRAIEPRDAIILDLYFNR